MVVVRTIGLEPEGDDEKMIWRKMQMGFVSGVMSRRLPFIAFGVNTHRQNLSIGATTNSFVARQMKLLLCLL